MQYYNSDEHEEDIQALSGGGSRKQPKPIYNSIYKKVMPVQPKARTTKDDESPFEKYKRQYVSWHDKNDKQYQRELRHRNKAVVERFNNLAEQRQYEKDEKAYLA